MPALLLLALLAAADIHTAACSGVFELQILEFSNYRLRLSSGACCGGGGGEGGGAGAAGGACASPCRTKFALCLKEYQSAVTAGGCSFGAVSSPVLGLDSFTLPEPSAHTHALALNFTFRWTRSFTLILQAYDDHNYTDPEESGLIEEASWSGIVEPSPAWHTLRHAGRAASLTYRVRVLCHPHYYNATCTTFCRERDDKFGHYACLPSGRKTCLAGWQGDNCEIPVCKEGCHPTHGRCDRPGDCDCRPGWRGELCAQCQPYPGCKHGYCNGSSWDCTCDTNWGGILCDQDLNYCGTHEPCQHGGTCENTAPDQYLCTCAEGFSGVDCERVDNPCAPAPCRHGACSLAAAAPGFRCNCAVGWSGALCDRDVDDCAARPCRNGATCRDLTAAFACDCAPGWSGDLCQHDVDECATSALGPCVNAASCANTAGGYTCACLAGWTGRDCETNVDDCAGQCQHGATCIDLVDDYHCACAAGYSGRACQLDVDECASRPCRNGGECVDLLDAYRCICPVGYTGDDCELPSCFGRYCLDDRDHCAGAPCANGAPCYNAQSDYYCHCEAGWVGKNCTQLAPVADVACAGQCAHGRCLSAPGPPGSPPRCLCDAGYAGELCDRKLEECASNPCRNNGTCVEGPSGEEFTCVCREGWRGRTCAVRACAACPAPAHCRDAPHAPGYRCLCPASSPRSARRCLELIASEAEVEVEASRETPAPAPDECDAVQAHNATWWWGCNVCWCGGGGGPSCTRLWCGLPDCAGGVAGAAGAGVAACRADEVCVPVAGALCLRAPCAAPAECRRVVGRRVEPPPLPAPSSCWPGPPPPPPAATAPHSPHCARAALRLAPERLSRGAHVERACAALRRALAAALAPAHRAARADLVLLCDLSAQDDDLVDLALWVSEDEGADGAWLLAESVRALSELVSRRRLPPHPLLAAALHLRVEPAPSPAPTTAPHPAAPSPAAAPAAAPAALLALGALPPLALLALGALAVLVVRRRRAATAAAECARRRDEDKSNNLQNEENLRRYANPLRPSPSDTEPRPLPHPHPLPAHLYKPQNADARNNTRLPDKECSKRVLPPPSPPSTPAPPALPPVPPAPPPAPPPALRSLPPERLTVLV